MPQYRVTGVIPCHNHRQWIHEALTSMSSQDRPPDCLMVIDDGSTDGSHQTVLDQLSATTVIDQGWQGTYQGIPLSLYRLNQAQGPSFARNFAIRAAWDHTDLFALLDSDDLYEAGKIRRSLEVFEQHGEDVACIYSDYQTWNPRTGVKIRAYKEPYSRQRLVRECLPNCDSLISKVALAECGLFDETMRTCEDYDLWMRFGEKFTLFHLPEHLLTIRVGDHSSTSTVPKEVWNQCYRRVFQKAQARMAGA